MDAKTTAKMIELRQEIIALAAVVVQIHGVLVKIRPYGDDPKSKEIDVRMKELSDRTDRFLDMLSKDSFNV